ncbi:hypothetical protein [Methylococcus mesophilus]|uniref:hypothetical protein n=1 Tax=Methylococcus mesophilus TaxID=2993564 RepID=UPI00224B6222|nr:hypothetical protein [Methylococcus mesophilus]UZR28749.1 hypothetical protein OOT43_18890 [Methylococcus mesophilus]
MKQVAEVPVPGVKLGQLLVWTSRYFGICRTERVLVDFRKAGWIVDTQGIDMDELIK